MTALSQRLEDYLAGSEDPRQVLVLVRSAPSAASSTGRDRCEHVLDLLRVESARDNRVKFNRLEPFNQISLTAPSEVIRRLALAAGGDIQQIVPDEPQDPFGPPNFF